DDEHAAQGRAHWQELASASVSAPALPFERPVDKTSFLRASVPVRIDSSLRAKLETLARQYDVSLPVLLFAGWQALVWRLTAQSEFVIFSLCDGRKLDDLKGALGLYDTYLPVRCQCDDIPFDELLVTTRGAINEAHDWQDCLGA